MEANVPGGAKRMETIAERLQERYVDDDGNRLEVAAVEEVVESTAMQYGDAPVQDFVPLVVEHQAADHLRSQGLRAEVADDRGVAGAPGPAGDADVAEDGGVDQWSAARLDGA